LKQILEKEMRMKLVIAIVALAAMCACGCAQEKAEHKHGHGHEGARQELGTTESAGMKLSAVQVGKVEAGKEGVFEVSLPKDAKAPKAVRLWVGNAAGNGSAKAKAENDGEDWEAHVEVPGTLAADAKLWVEVQPDSGSRAKVSFELKK
jgi:hypothetical protein